MRPLISSAMATTLLLGCQPPGAGGALSIYPESPETTDTLVAVMADAVAGYRYTWSQDGETVAELSEGHVPAELTTRGETWTVRATPVDGFAGEELEASVTIVDARPSVSVVLSPAEPGGSDDLVAIASAEDPDGDALTLEWSWSADDALQVGLTQDTVPASMTSYGEVWTVTVTPSDASGAGISGEASVEIGNALPEISSASITPEEAYTDTTLSVSATATDADGDDTSISTEWLIDGTATGITESTLSPEWTKKGHLITASVTPSDGASEGATFIVGPVEILNTPPDDPELALEADGTDEDLVCEIISADSDLDGDTLSYDFEWLVDGTKWSGATETTLWTGDTIAAADLSASQEWTCMVTASDGEDLSSQVSITTTLMSSNVTYRSGYYWVRATYAASSSDHSAVCQSEGLQATGYEVSLTWDETLLSDLSSDFGYTSAGDANDAATSMWCYDKGSSYPTGNAEGTCETHNFGSAYTNYGYWGSYSNQRPVFTCTK